jgi:hypothetical protein
MYSTVEEYFARWLGVTVFSALLLVYPWMLLGLARNEAGVAGLWILSMALGTLHVVWVARKRKAKRRESNQEQPEA